MKNLNLIFVAIIFALFALTSCEKESMQEMTQTATTEINERNLPNGNIQTSNPEVRTLASAETIKAQATSRSNGTIPLAADHDLWYSSTIGEGNSSDARDYPSCVTSQVGDSFEGNDKYFSLVIDRTLSGSHITHHFVLSELTADLDMFLFALDQYGRVMECKAVSITQGYDAEKISVSGLNEGAYLLVVDGWAKEIAGEFKLEKYITAVTPNPPSVDPERPETPPVGGAQSMQNARFIDFLGGDAGLTGNGWMVTRNGQAEIFEDYEATATVLTMNNYKVVDGKEIETTITFNKSTKWVTSKTKWRQGYASGSSSWSASIRDIEYGN